MKYFLIITFLFVSILAGCQKQQQLETTKIKANTMVCANCAKTVKKAVYQVEGVKEVDIDVDMKTVEVKYVPLQTNTETIERAITDAGYDANDKKRDPAAYEKLDECCKMDQ